MVHETALREVLTVPAGVWVVHEVPFHSAASESSFPPPTAAQKVADWQETETMSVNPVGAGPADHDVPSQVSTWAKPSTVMQKSALAQDTACGSTSPAPGRVWSVHDVPFHISVRAPVEPPPTASQNCGETQETW